MRTNTKLDLFIADLELCLGVSKLSLYDISDKLFTNVSKMGINIYELDLDAIPDIGKIRGAFRVDSGVVNIYLNEKDSYVIKRETLGKVMGCLYLKHNYSYECPTMTNDCKEIIYANR